jgi:ABC-type multidrug transport system fused ATPase/permease subunit
MALAWRAGPLLAASLMLLTVVAGLFLRSSRAGLRDHRAGQTSVLISHRLSAVRDADVIVVIADGTIAEHGRHHELVTAGRRYARLFDLQEKRYSEPVGNTP